MRSWFNEWYHNTLDEILDMPTEMNKRTGVGVKALPNRAITIDPFQNQIQLLRTRRFFPKAPAGEVAWWLKGTQDTTFLKKYCPHWKNFEDSENHLENSYGYRWQHEHGFDQLSSVISKLLSDPSSRQAHVQTWKPSDLFTKSNNIPCPTSWTINILPYQGKQQLHMSIHLRSSDFIMGLPYDHMTYSLFQDMIATTLDVEVGTLQFSIAHAHVYENHFEIAENMLKNFGKKDSDANIFIERPHWSLINVKNDPDAYVTKIMGSNNAAIQTYKAVPGVVV